MNSHAVLGTCQAATFHGDPWNNKIRALVDTGSQLNLITIRASKRLGLTILRANANLIGVETTSSQSTGYVLVSIKIPEKEQPHTEKFYVVKQITRHLPFETFNLGQHNEFKKLTMADPNFGTPGEIDALFGINLWIKILCSGVIKSNDGMVAAQQTLFGWVIYSQENINNHQSTNHLLHITKMIGDSASNGIEPILEKFWQVEDIPTVITFTSEEKECERIFRECHKRNKSGRYIVHLPFNDKLQLLGKSKSIATKQFYAMENKMQRNEEFKNKYHEFMREFIELGHLEKITEKTESGYYTPHHGVVTSEKFRVVINASCKTSTGISLNECQLVGAKLQSDLANILMRFRSYEIALSVDIVKMFRQVEVTKAHRKYQKILWRFSANEPLGVYQFNRVIYGQAAAPFLAVRAMRQCAIDNEQEFPIGAKAILESFYVDDGLTGADSMTEALTLRHQLTNLLKRGQFELAKWASNKRELLESNNPTFLEIREPEIKSVLGLRWVPEGDTFVYKIDPKSSKENWTKREILSEIGKLYDPNGYISPVVITAKIIMQKIWMEKIDWDDQASPTIQVQWTNFLRDLMDLNKISIPRWLGMKGIWHSELHTFSDASEAAYAAVVYVKTTTVDGNVFIRLVQSKTKVAPLKKLTVPRLELCGAHIAAKLAEVVLNEFENRISHCYFWTDSQIVLLWLTKASSQLKTFVANRVAAIQHKTIEKGFGWKWVAGENNPADLASRGIQASNLATNSLWWNGPDWLKLTESNWPKCVPPPENSNGEISAEFKIVSHIMLKKPLLKGPWFNSKSKSPMIAYKNFKRQRAEPLLSAYSSFTKIKRVMATVLRAIYNFRKGKKGPRKIGPLSSTELQQAKIKLIQMDQERTFLRELTALKNNEPCENASIWLDTQNNILRLSGRVQSDNLAFNEMYPIILSPKGDLTPLIIREAHLNSLHGGVQLTLQIVREQFWVEKARFLTRNIINQCPTCFRHKIKLSKQLMAVLPKQRTKPQRPFSVVGVDYMGPIGLSSKTGRNPVITKGYVCVFVCFCTRAIHLELVSSATTASFMQALRRFIARRGSVKTIWSDNGTNFVGANGFLNQIYEKQYEWAYGQVAEEFRIEWKFNTPYAPHHGGLHEAAVKSSKHHLLRVIGKQNLTFEEYYTLLTQVEACVNSRPLHPLSDDPNDLVALTPAHFLVGEPLVTLTESDNVNETQPWRLSRWELVQQMFQHWWTRWHNEYVTTLLQRPKWRELQRNIQVGDLVLIKEDNVAPSHWIMGRVKQTFPAPDGLVRSAMISTIYGDYKRPITKLGVLLNETDESINLSELNPKEAYAKLGNKK